MLWCHHSCMFSLGAWGEVLNCRACVQLMHIILSVLFCAKHAVAAMLHLCTSSL